MNKAKRKITDPNRSQLLTSPLTSFKQGDGTDIIVLIRVDVEHFEFVKDTLESDDFFFDINMSGFTGFDQLSQIQ